MHCKNLPVAPYKALENYSKALYGTTGGTYSARVFRPVMAFSSETFLYLSIIISAIFIALLLTQNVIYLLNTHRNSGL